MSSQGSSDIPDTDIDRLLPEVDLLSEQLRPNNKPSRKRNLDDLQDDWDDHEGYMHAKERKLQNQFEGMGIEKKSNIFEGVSIYVNGWTQPKADELKEMIYAHGGIYKYNFHSRSVVTHTIASTLPNSKILNIGSSIVCKPNWIVDSIAQNVLLPVNEYLLYKPQNGQKKLSFSKPTPDSEERDSEDSREQRIDGDNEDRNSASMVNPKRAEFVSEFFTHSRLHYLSTWSTELKQFTADMLRKITPRQPKLPSSASLKGLGIRAFVHIDLDCFFVSVSIRTKPHLKDKPVAVTHAKLPKGTNSDVSSVDVATAKDSVRGDPHHNPLDSTSDIASCSYKARDAGVSNGMLVGTALKKCPDLILLPYDFKSYREVSQTFYETLLHYSSTIEAVSCDEAYLELTEYCRDCDHVSQVVRELRNEVHAKTGCTVSAGISHNMLLARMCTRVAKPDGQFYLLAKESVGFFDSQKVGHLPGVGYSLGAKLKEIGVDTCGDLKVISQERLQSQFGTKTGKMLHDYAHGVDHRELKTSTERKSVSVDINFGIRFKDISEANALLGSISQELQKRAEQARVVGNQLTLKMKIRKQDAPIEPKKFLGHGACDNVSRSLALLQPSREAAECGSLAARLLKQLNPVASDIRGMGLQLSKLVFAEGESSGGGARSSGADLRTMLKGNREPTSSVQQRAQPGSNLSTESARRAAQPITPQKPASRGKKLSTKRSPGRPLKKSPGKSPGKVPVKSLAKPFSKSLKKFFVSSAKVDDSFRIDLPPASQLDTSVLAELPSFLCQKILEGYAGKEKLMVPKKEGNCALLERVDTALQVETKREVVAITMPAIHATKHKSITDAKRKWKAIRKDEIEVGDERVFLSSWKKYISKLCSSSGGGPDWDDHERTADYLSKLARTNLEMTELCLKSFRRFVELRTHIPAWVSGFNTMLQQVQEKIKEFYGGDLKIEGLS